MSPGLFRFSRYLSHVAAWHLVADMRVRVYDHQKPSMKYHDKQTENSCPATNDTSTFEVLIAHAVPDLVANILVLLGVTAILFYIHPLLALLTIIPVPVLTYSGFLFSRKVLPYFRKAQKSLAELNAVLQDNISGMKEIQVFNQQKKEKSRVATRAADYTRLSCAG